MADNYYQQQSGRGYSSGGGGRRGRGRGYRGRGGRQYSNRGGGRDSVAGRLSFPEVGGRASSSRGRGNYYGRSTTSVPPVPPPPPLLVQQQQQQQGGRGDGGGGRFSTTTAMSITNNNNNNNNNAMTDTSSSMITSGAPMRGRGSRGSGRFYDGRGGRRGRGRYSGRGRGGRLQEGGRSDWSGRAAGIDPPQQQWTQNPVTIINPTHDAGRGSGGTDWAGRERDWSASNTTSADTSTYGDSSGWNNERTSSFSGPSSDRARDSGWHSHSNTTSGAPMEIDSRGGTNDWAGGQDREWSNNQNQTGQSGGDWKDRNRSWKTRTSSFEETRGINSGAAPMMMSTGPPEPAARTNAFPYSDDGDGHLKRKRGDQQQYNTAGPPPPREAPTSSYASLGEGEFHNPSVPAPPKQPVVMDEQGPQTQTQRYPSSSTTWRGRGRGRGRGPYQAKRYSGRGGDFAYQSGGRGVPPSHYQDLSQQSQQYHGAPPVGGSNMPDREVVPPGLSAYGPQPNDLDRTGPSDYSTFPSDEGGAGRGSYGRRPSREGVPSSRAPPPPPPPPHIAPPSNTGMQASDTSVGSSDQWKRPPPPVHERPISTGSYASLAAENPFVVAQPKKEPELPAPPPPGMTYQQQEMKEPELPPVQTKALTPPPPEPVVARPPSPPSPVGPPSGLMVALARLADVESQLDFALAKHMRVSRERELIQEQTKHLEQLPVWQDAFGDL